MNQNQSVVLLMLAAGLSFIGLSVAAAIAMFSLTPVVRVIALAGEPGLTDADPAASASGTSSGSTANPAQLLLVAQNNDTPIDQRTKAVAELALLSGSDIANGRQVFTKHCIACHRVGDEGAELAPNLSDVGKRLARDKIVESLVHPSAIVEEKYKTTMVLTLDGDVITGLLVVKSDEEVTIFDGNTKENIKVLVDDIDEMATKDQSSMPERLPDAMSPQEFLDLVEYLSGLQLAPE